MFLFPFLEKSKKLLKWTGEHLTTPVNLDEHGATRNMKKAWRIATFLYIGELRWQMFNGSPKRKAVGSNPARDASQQPRKIRKMSSALLFSRILGPFSANIERGPLAENQYPAWNANGPKMPLLRLLLNPAACQLFSVVSLCISVQKSLFSGWNFREFHSVRNFSAKKFETALAEMFLNLWKSKIARLG